MATDNTVLNAGTGGDTIRDLADATGAKWPVSVLCYATTVSPGANVLQEVMPGYPLPVEVSNTVPVSGTFWQATQPVSGTVTADQGGAWIVGLNAGTALIGQAAATPQLGSIYSGTTLETVQTAAISASAAGANTIVASVAGKRIYVLRWSLRAAGPVTIQWQDSTPANLSGPRPLVAYAGDGGDWCPGAIYATAAGAGLVLYLSAAEAVGGELTYCQI